MGLDMGSSQRACFLKGLKLFGPFSGAAIACLSWQHTCPSRVVFTLGRIESDRDRKRKWVYGR